MSKPLKTICVLARPWPVALATAFFWMAGFGLAFPLLAQTGANTAPTTAATPTPEQMIEQLKPSRTRSLRNFLKTQGVASDRLLAAGKGASELANSTAPFAAENRRVRIVNLD